MKHGYVYIASDFKLRTDRASGRNIRRHSRQLLRVANDLLGRPESPFCTGLYFAPDVFFVSPRVLRAPSTDRPETLPHVRNLTEFYKLTSKFGERSPQKIGGQKHAKFRSILDHFRL